jgi:hypothetical protein
MDYLIVEAVALKANREEEEARKAHEAEQKREAAKQENKEKLRRMFGN